MDFIPIASMESIQVPGEIDFMLMQRVGKVLESNDMALLRWQSLCSAYMRPFKISLVALTPGWQCSSRIAQTACNGRPVRHRSSAMPSIEDVTRLVSSFIKEAQC
eukprot:1158366-Pelagomonas_calceolata.AAC.4